MHELVTGYMNAWYDKTYTVMNAWLDNRINEYEREKTNDFNK